MNSSHSELTDKLFVRIYHDNKSSYKQVSTEKIFKSAGYACLSDIQHVFHFNYKNNFLEIVTMPTQDPDFICVDVHNMWYANRINLDKKLDLDEPSTFDFLIKNGLDINKAFVYACLTNRADVVRYLIELGADIGFDDDRPIATAVSAGHSDIAKYLFDTGSYQGRSNDAIIEDCIYWNRAEMFDYVFTRSQSVNIDKILDMACNSNKPEIIKYILNRGYQTCHTDSFEYMCYTGDIDTVKKFIKNGVDVRKHTEAFARAYAHPDIVELLIEAGADVQANNNRALDKACSNGCLPTVKMLINHGADFRFDNDYALRQAARYGRFDVVKYLVDIGCDIRIDNNFVLNQAARYGNLEMVKTCENLGIDITDNDVLKIACDYGRFDIVKYIVEQITDTSYNYYNSIESAAKHHYFQIVMCLLDKISDSQIITDVATYLTCLGNLDIIRYIFDNKKDIGNLDDALTKAIHYGHIPIIDYLIKNGACVKFDLDLALRTSNWRAILNSVMHLMEIGINIQINVRCVVEHAALYGYLDAVKYFIKKDSNIESYLDSVINIAIRSNNLDIVKFIFDRFDIANVDTYFTYACQTSVVDTVKFFSVNDIGKETINKAAKLAFESKNFANVLYLVENGASSDYLTKIKQELEYDLFVKL